MTCTSFAPALKIADVTPKLLPSSLTTPVPLPPSVAKSTSALLVNSPHTKLEGARLTTMRCYHGATMEERNDPEREICFHITEEFHLKFAAHGGYLKLKDLKTLKCTTKELWHACAESLLAKVRTSVGIPIQVRSAQALSKAPTLSLQLYTEDIPIASMCAHPTSFRILAQHAANLLGAEPCFYTWTSRMLVVLPQNATSDCFPQWLAKNHPDSLYFVYAQGLPYIPRIPALEPTEYFTPSYYPQLAS